MASNNNNKPQQQQQQSRGYGPNPGQSGNDPRGRSQNQIQYQQQRYESQQGPLANAMGQNYGRGSETDFGDRADIMNQYRDIASGGGSGSSGGGGGGGGGGASSFNTFTVNPERISAERANTERANYSAMGPARQMQSRQLNPQERVSAGNPYESYAGMKEFSQTGGYSDSDVANMRARGMAPVRAAYGNAERAVGQQRGLQGGYSPNAIAAQVKMAREQGQSMADAGQNVEAQIAQDRNKGRLSGLQGMTDIEKSRQMNELDAAKFNAQEGRLGNQFDIETGMGTDQFNIGNEMDVEQFNVGNQMDISKFNAGEGNQVGMFNAGQGNQTNQFNADLGMKGQMYNADAFTRTQDQQNAAAESAASRRSASSSDDQRMRLAALEGMTNLYGTTPGMSNTFGNQVSNIVGQGGNMGLGMIDREQNNYQIPGQYDQTAGRVSDMMNLAGRGMDMVYPWLNGGNTQRQAPVQQPQQPSFRTPLSRGTRF